MRFGSAEHRAAVAVDQLAALRPEHRQVIEDRRLPAPGVVEIAGDRRARGRRGSPSSMSSSHVRGGVGHQILAIEERAAVGLVPQAVDVAAAIRQRLDRERQEVGAIRRRASTRSSGCRWPPSRNSGSQKLSIEATSGSRPDAAASSSLALCCSSAGIIDTSSWMSGFAAAQSSNTVLKRVGDRRQRREVRVVLLRPDRSVSGASGWPTRTGVTSSWAVAVAAATTSNTAAKERIARLNVAQPFRAACRPLAGLKACAT